MAFLAGSLSRGLFCVQLNQLMFALPRCAFPSEVPKWSVLLSTCKMRVNKDSIENWLIAHLFITLIITDMMTSYSKINFCDSVTSLLCWVQVISNMAVYLVFSRFHYINLFLLNSRWFMILKHIQLINALEQLYESQTFHPLKEDVCRY